MASSTSVLSLTLVALGGLVLGGLIGRQTKASPPTPAPKSSPAAEPVGPTVPVRVPIAPPAVVKRPNYQHLAPGSRLNTVARLITRISESSADELWTLHDQLKQADRNGGDTRIERQLVLYRIGQLLGPDAIRRRFRTDPDRREIEYGSLLEGWAQQHPGAAISWWQTLPAGNMRSSLVTPLLQGCASRGPEFTKMALQSIPITELGLGAGAALQSVLAKEGLAAGVELFKDGLDPGKGNWAARQKLHLALVQHAEDSSDIPAMKHSLELLAADLLISADHLVRLAREIAAKDGAETLTWLAELPAAHPEVGQVRYVANKSLMPAAASWVQAQPGEAMRWLEQHKGEPNADLVAFQLAISHMKNHPEKAQRFAGQVVDADLAETIVEILE